MKDKSIAHFIFPLAAVFCLTPFVSSAGALVLGLVLTLTVGNPYSEWSKKMIHRLLALSIVGLGAGMNLAVVGKVGLQGIAYTVIGILFTLFIGTLLGKLFKTERDTSLLITVGTAICGGSAIAAVAPVIRARNHDVSVALGTVFILNAVALILFPWIGHSLKLGQTEFGLWSALAIHDTSSVVGATLHYGAQALEVGTTIKLARALWIIPVAMLIGVLRSKENSISNTEQKAKRPWFILGFIIAAASVTWIPSLEPTGKLVADVAKQLMVLTLFLIGSGLSKEAIKSVGLRPFAQGIALWIVTAGTSLAAIMLGWIH